MLKVTRIYKNADGDTLRIDSIRMDPNYNPAFQGGLSTTYKRQLTTQTILEPSDRDVATIAINTGGDSYESSTGNYLWVKWSKFPVCQCDMSDLPKVGDTI